MEYSSAPNEVRTRVLALRGPRPGPLDNGGGKRRNFTIYQVLRQLQALSHNNFNKRLLFPRA